MNETGFEDSWLFYHDALSHLAAKDTREYMSNTIIDGKKIIDRWLFPMNNLSKNTPYDKKRLDFLPYFGLLLLSTASQLHIKATHHEIEM